MRNKLFKLFALVIAPLYFISVHAAVECEPEYEPRPAIEEQICGAYNHPAKVDVCGAWDYFLSGSFIWWQPREKGLEFAIREKTSEDGNIQTYTPVDMDFDYHPGFKLALGTNFDHDDWSLYANYMRLYTKDDRTSSFPSEEYVEGENALLASWFMELPLAIEEYISGYSAKGSWKLHMNIVDLSLSRTYYVGNRLVFNPFIGARGGWIYQKYHSFYKTTSDDASELYGHDRTKSWLVGARTGIDTKWLLGEGFRMFGNASASLFYQYFKTKIRHFTYADYSETRIDYDKGYINPNTDLSVGFGWGDYFYDDSWHIDISLAYEFHIFWNQNMMKRVMDFVEQGVDSEAGDLVLHGLTATLQLDF